MPHCLTSKGSPRSPKVVEDGRGVEPQLICFQAGAANDGALHSRTRRPPVAARRGGFGLGAQAQWRIHPPLGAAGSKRDISKAASSSTTVGYQQPQYRCMRWRYGLRGLRFKWRTSCDRLLDLAASVKMGPDLFEWFKNFSNLCFSQIYLTSLKVCRLCFSITRSVNSVCASRLNTAISAP
jgi:hypothetical protein